jgi:hypothetical protein
MTSHEYETHLASIFWQETRGRVFVRDRGRCQRCRKRRATQVHHWTYKRLGDERLNDLVAFCRSCHDAVGIARSGQLALPIKVDGRNYLDPRLAHPAYKRYAEVQYVDAGVAQLARYARKAQDDGGASIMP